jgi:thymidine phosphorylase
MLVGDRAAAERALADGSAYERYQRWISAQGGDPDAALPRAPTVEPVQADRSGVVQRCHALAVGRVAGQLGAGRASAGDAVDPAVGIVVHRKRGDAVRAGERLATVHARAPFDADAVRGCFEIADAAADPDPLVIEALGA